MLVAEEMREVEDVAACKANQCLRLVLGERLVAANTMTRFGVLLGFMSHEVFRKVRRSSTVNGTGNIRHGYIDVVHGLVHHIELDSFPLPRAKCVLRNSHLAPQHFRDALADTVLQIMFFNHPAETLSQTLDLKSFWYPSDQRDRIDRSSNFFKQTSNESWFVHRIIEKIFPKISVVLLFGKRNRLGDVGKTINDES